MGRTARSTFLAFLAISAAACAGAAGHGHAADLAAARSASPRGSAVYARDCADCHGRDGEGGGSTPKLVGEGALPAQGSAGPLRTAADLFAYVKGNMPMPRSKAGSLPDADYWAVVTYLVAANRHEVPEGGLTPGNAASVAINP
jgi:mono/diheme cytochrome c family protein